MLPQWRGRIIRFLAETGMRQEEVCGMEWPRVSIQRREVGLTKTKTSSPRLVPLSDAAFGALAGTPRRKHIGLEGVKRLTLRRPDPAGSCD